METNNNLLGIIQHTESEAPQVENKELPVGGVDPDIDKTLLRLSSGP